MIMAADEISANINKFSIDLYLELIDGSNKNVIGYSNTDSKEIYTYSTMFDQMGIDDLANHYVY